MVTKVNGSRSELACIPSSSSIRERLATIQEEVRKLSILLRTAEELEIADTSFGDQTETPRC